MRNKEQPKHFDALKLTLASPDQILDWSYGEVTKAETINYRTFKSEPDGLFCEKIFGPTKNYECYCGKYKKIRYKGIVCDKCGVEVTTKDVRRERMGHIKLSIPVAHVWFAYGIPNKMSIVLNVSHKKLLSVIYYTRYMVVSMETEKRTEMKRRAEQLRDAEIKDLGEQLKEELKEVSKEFDNQTKKLGRSQKDQFSKSQIEHKKKQELAKIKRDYAEREEILDGSYTKVLQLIAKLEIGSILTEDEYIDFKDKELLFFEAMMGAKAVKKLLEDLDLEKEIKKLKSRFRKEKGEKRATTIRRVQYLAGFKENGMEPSWMVLDVLPVLPPELRPIIPISGGKFATSDLNDLYRRIINRNNRLKKLMEIGAPDVILRNEKRMLQESVDALIDNSHRPSKAMLNNKRLPYQSLTDDLRGKKGLFRKNLLGKRVDYSGRAVIIGDAALKIDECGLPKSVALEVFKPFVIHKLMEEELASNIRIAKDIIDDKEDIIWDLLEEIIEGRPVLLNRAPTLHKYSIQAFYPKLVEGEAIRIHPLVCKAFNADFDGDQMSVHILLTNEAIEEAKKSIMASKNIVDIKNGRVLANPSKDMLLGYYLLTDKIEIENPRFFGSFGLAIKAYERGIITHKEEIIVKDRNGNILNTSVGRVIFNSHLPEDYPFVDERINSAKISKIIAEVKDNYPFERVIELLDDLKSLGFKYATDLAFSFAMEDCNIKFDLKSRIKKVEVKSEQLQENYMQGLITEKEKLNIFANMWNDFATELADKAWNVLDSENSISEMVESGANGGKIQARQVLAIKGLVRDSQGHWVPLPIKGNYRDGLGAFEYFISANGGRKGIADRSLKTSASGYLTRKLVDVAHNVIIRTEDCGYDGEGFAVSRSADRRMDFVERLYGRTLTKDVKDGGKILAKKGEVITKFIAKKIDTTKIENVYTRSPLLCKSPLGICKKCYGHSLENGEEVEMGRAVGVIAAQSIGEPGTQMTMQTFHKGGVQRTDITQGLPRIEELFEARRPKAVADISSIDGKVSIQKAEDESVTITIVGKKHVQRSYIVSDAKKMIIESGQKVKIGQVMYIDFENGEKQAPFNGKVLVEGGILTIEGNMKTEEIVSVPPKIGVLVKTGQEVKTGDQLTEGSIDPKKLAEIAGLGKAQRYILDNVQKVFNEQGVAIGDVHIEIIIRQMTRLGRVLNTGDTEYLIGSYVNRYIAETKNELLLQKGKNKVLVIPLLLGIKASSLHTESFLSAMSFQEQVRVLTHSAILGKQDYLRGMKENVIIGRRIFSGEEARIENTSELPEVKI